MTNADIENLILMILEEGKKATSSNNSIELIAKNEGVMAALENLKVGFNNVEQERDFNYAVIDALQDLAILSDGTGKIVNINEAGLSLLGYKDKTEVVGRLAKDLLSTNPYVNTGGDHSKYQFKNQHNQLIAKNKTKIPVLFSSSLITIPSYSSPYFLGIAKETDINSSLNGNASMADSIEKLNKEIDDFVYIISHDLKAPIRAIVNLSQWIEDDLGQSISEDSKKMMELMKGRVNRMQALINSLLQYSRVTRPGEIQNGIEVDKVVDGIVQNIKSSKEFSVDHSGALPVLDHNPVWIENLFSHLINNAVQHHDKPKATVHIHYESKDGYHVFSINDDGPGIPEGSKEKIFGIFQTLEARDTHESTGVGLAIVKKILEKMGGDIWVESKEGAGATFIFRIPV